MKCPECDRRFDVIWSNDGLGPPEYCPMCGAEIDYQSHDDNVPKDFRDDRNLVSLCCPHCKEVVPALRVDLSTEFKQWQLLYMECPSCGKGITKDQLAETYREYVPSQ